MDNHSEDKGGTTEAAAGATTTGAKSLVGKVIGKKYKIVEQIGAGAMGAVYKAEHTWMDRIVALKVLHTHLVHSDTSIRRFQNEARTASKITHPNAVTLYDFGIDGALPYLAMRFAAGRTLKSMLKEEGRLSLERVTTILSQVGGALGEAHSLGIIHRDLKPDNIMVSTSAIGEDWAEVLDFGIAKATASVDDGHVVTQTGMVIGTPQYMSPEQASGKQLDIRSDIYSLGVILYEMLSGEIPISAGSVMEVLMAQINEKPMPLRKASADASIPKEVERVVMKALEKDPARRQSTVQDLVEEFLQAVADHKKKESVSTKSRLLLAAVCVVALAAGGTAVIVSNLSTDAPLEEQLAAAPFGQISIDSRPSGAAVYLKGSARGSTPLLITDVAPGSYRVTLRLDGHLDRSHTLEVTQGMTTQATFPLKQEDSMLASADIPVETPEPTSEPRMSAEQRLAAEQALSDLEQQARAERQKAVEPPEQPAPADEPAAEPTAEPTAPPAAEDTAEATAEPRPESTPAATSEQELDTREETPDAEDPEADAAKTLSPVEEEQRLKTTAKEGTQVPPTPAPTAAPTPAPTAEPQAAEEEEAIVIVQKPTALSKQDEAVNVAALSTPPEDPSSPTELVAQAERLFRQGQVSQAILRLEEALQKNSRMVNARLLLGRCYLKQAAGQSTPALRNRKAISALKEFTEAFRVQPGNAEVRYNKAVAYAVMRNKRKVLQELEAAVKSNPSLRARAKKDPNFTWLRSDYQFKNL